MRKSWPFVSFLCGIATAFLLIAIVPRDEEPPDPNIVETVVASRNVIISLPEGYRHDATNRYPVLYVLDGSSQTPPTAESARLLARIGAIPEVIVVGIPSSDENRALDYTP